MPGRGRALLSDWGLFATALILLVALDGLVFVLIDAWGLPVRVGYAIGADKALLGGQVASHHLQAALLGDRVGALEHALVAIHGASLLAVLVVGACVWRWRRAQLQRFQIAVLAVLVVGLVGQLLAPTVPPWMAAGEFELLAPLRHVSADVHGGAPARWGVLAPNPLGAMPSVVAALSVLGALIAVGSFGRRGAAAVAYTAVASVAALHLAEQYLVTVVAGALVAVAVHLLVYRVLARRIDALAARPPLPGRTRALVAGLFLSVALAAVAVQRERGGGWLPPATFAESELAGASPVADYWLGYHAHAAGDHAAAAAAFERLPLRRHDADTLRMFGVSLAAERRVDEALAALDEAAARRPTDPRPLHLSARIGYQHERLTEADVLAIVHILFHRFATDPARALAEDLEEMLME